MSGIYLHIPFCKQACYYCNFHFSTSLVNKKEMISAMLNEINLAAPFSAEQPVDTIYFGGGTPSLISSEDIANLLNAIKKIYVLDEHAEITLEANPDDINPHKLTQWIHSGINRLSIGVQSFNQKDLEWMNRAHNSDQARHCLELVKNAGFTNFSVDLIYGSPLLDELQWKDNIGSLIALKVPHLSCYALTVEPSTALQKMIAQKKREDIDPDKQASHFLLLMDMMQSAGYEHYEISNFALPGHRSRHNSGYWQGKFYTGIGPSAHSYFGSTRRWNVSNNQLYIRSLQNNEIPFQEETLSVTQQLNEYIMLSLRTMEGVDLDFVEKHFGRDKHLRLATQSMKFVERLFLKRMNNNIVLTKEGRLFADGIAADLFFTAT